MRRCLRNPTLFFSTNFFPSLNAFLKIRFLFFFCWPKSLFAFPTVPILCFGLRKCFCTYHIILWQVFSQCFSTGRNSSSFFRLFRFCKISGSFLVFYFLMYTGSIFSTPYLKRGIRFVCCKCFLFLSRRYKFFLMYLDLRIFLQTDIWWPGFYNF